MSLQTSTASRGSNPRNMPPVLVTTYKHRYRPYNAEDLLIVQKPELKSKTFEVTIQSVRCTHTPSYGDALTRVVDGGFTYGCIITPFDATFIVSLRKMGYAGVVFAYGKDVEAEKAFEFGYDGILRQIDRATMVRLIAVFQDILLMNEKEPADNAAATPKRVLSSRSSRGSRLGASPITIK